MMSISNETSPTIGERILAAAADCVLAFGVDRVTLAEIARRARVSRPTVYRMMKDGALHFVRIRGRRLIPCTEYTRLGFIAEAAE